jgi:hypothetical protein
MELKIDHLSLKELGRLKAKWDIMKSGADSATKSTINGIVRCINVQVGNVTEAAANVEEKLQTGHNEAETFAKFASIAGCTVEALKKSVAERRDLHMREADDGA